MLTRLETLAIWFLGFLVVVAAITIRNKILSREHRHHFRQVAISDDLSEEIADCVCGERRIRPTKPVDVSYTRISE